MAQTPPQSSPEAPPARPTGTDGSPTPVGAGRIERPATWCRVAMVIQRFRPDFTGQGVQVEQLCTHLARRGVASSIMTAVRGKPGDRERGDGLVVRRLRCDVPGLGFTARSGRFWMPVFALRVLLALLRCRREVDVVHVHGYTDGLLGAWIFGRLTGTPVIFEMTLLGDDDPLSVQRRDHRLRWLRVGIFRRCDRYIAMSEAFREPYLQADLPAESLRLIPQGVDVERFAPTAKEDSTGAPSSLGLPTDGPLVVFVGSLVHRKGIDVVLEAWAAIHAAHPDAALVLIGSDDAVATAPPGAGGLVDGLERLSPEAAARVLRLGLRDDVAALLRACDVMLFPSRQEGFGSVIIEAMASGLPCVVAELPGITDLIFEHAAVLESASDATAAAIEPMSDATPAAVESASDVTPGAGPRASLDGARVPDGIVVPQADAATTAAAVVALLEDPARRAAIGAAARRRVVAAFAFERVAGLYGACYAELTSRSPANDAR